MLYPSNVATPVGYGQVYPYPLVKPVNTGPAGGQTIRVITIVIAAGVLIGMGLGLGLGIGAAGIIDDGMLMAVTNITNNATISSTISTNTTSTAVMTFA